MYCKWYWAIVGYEVLRLNRKLLQTAAAAATAVWGSKL